MTVSKTPRTKKNQASKSSPKSAAKAPVWKRIVHFTLTFVSVIVAAALVITGYAGNVSPLQSGGLWGVLPLGFPLVLLAAVLILILDLCFYWRSAIVLILGIIGSCGPILTYFPVNIVTPTAPEGSEKLTVLTYNVLNLDPQSGDTVTPNPMLQFVLAHNADVVCLQEAEPLTPNKRLGITSAQVDSLHARYPYIIYGGKGTQAILSKYPAKVVHLDVNENTFASGDLQAVRITMPSGRLVSVFNVHLFSFALTTTDRELYRNLTDLKHENMREVKDQLWDKLTAASEGRAREVQQLMRWLRQYGGPDVIVCGDFNDVSGCYAIRTLGDAGFRDTYPEVGFGPMVTYNANRFWFCIDHLLYRGHIKPLDLTKGSTKASDHYPLIATFAVTQ